MGLKSASMAVQLEMAYSSLERITRAELYMGRSRVKKHV